MINIIGAASWIYQEITENALGRFEVGERTIKQITR
jgi:hypothetical protein